MSFSRWIEPDHLLEAVSEVQDELNTFLQDKNINDVLDIRFATGRCGPKVGDRVLRMYHIATVIFLG